MDAEINLRPTTDDDEELLLAIYSSTRQEETAAFGWPDEQRDAFLKFQFTSRRGAYKVQFPAAEYSVILISGEPAGSLIVERREDAISLTDIALLPEFHRRGIGSRILDMLKAEAAAAGRPLVLSVDHSNPRARRFYLDRGFIITGETQVNCSMKWTPDDAKDDISLRPVDDADRALLLRVYEASRETELGAVQWDENLKRVFLEHQFDAQDAHYRKHYVGATFDVINYNGEPCGRLLVHRGEDQIAIMDLTVLPEFRGRGIGSEMVRRVTGEAAGSGRSVRVFLEVFNPHQTFFTKRGFTVVEDDGVSRRYEWHDDPAA